MIGDISASLYVEDRNLHFFQNLRGDKKMGMIPTPPECDHMRVFKEEKKVRQLAFYPLQPELMLEIPGLLVIY